MHCGFCGKDELQSVTETEHFQYRDKSLEVDGYSYSVCAACGEEVVTPDQMKINQRLVADAKRRADGFLASAEIRQLRDRLALSQADAGKVFGGGPNAFYKYENGEVMQSQAVDRLMVLARDDFNTYQRLRALAGLPELVGRAEQVFVTTARSDTRAVIDALSQPLDQDTVTVQRFLATVSGQTNNVQIPANWVH